MHCCVIPGIPTTIKTMGVNITTIDYLRVLIIEIGSTIILMVVEAQGHVMLCTCHPILQDCVARCQCSVRQSGNFFLGGLGLVSAMCSCTTIRCIEICSNGMIMFDS